MLVKVGALEIRQLADKTSDEGVDHLWGALSLVDRSNGISNIHL